MTAQDLLNLAIPAMRGSDTVQQTLDRMDEYKVSHLAVVEGQHYLGIIAEPLLLNQLDYSLTLSELPLEAKTGYVLAKQHFYDIYRTCADNNMSVVAVLDSELHYLGCTTLTDVAEAYGRIYSMQMPGAVLVISMNERDYSMAQIARLVESNNLRVLNSFVEMDEEDPQRISLTLKINNNESSRVVATLERFGYIVMAQYNALPGPDADRDRLDSLLHYLSV
jgi:acetoin utilization protein AcuB